MTDLNKHLSPQSMASLRSSQDARGPLLADPTKQMNFHPEANQPTVNSIEAINNSPEMHQALNEDMGGLSSKKLFKGSDGSRFLLKPYHERAPEKVGWMLRTPTSGWAEATMQGLYHAGDIGHLIQKSHVLESGGKHYTAIHIEPKFLTLSNADDVPIRELHAKSGLRLYDDAAKIALMDYLSNNQDRHRGNLMVARPNPLYQRLMAIDHGLAFQYVRPLRHAVYATEDHPSSYVMSPGIRALDTKHLDPFLHDPHVTGMVWNDESIDRAMRWWKSHSHAIRDEFHRHADALVHPEWKDHVTKNFLQRHANLDKMSAKWSRGVRERGLEGLAETFRTTKDKQHDVLTRDLFHGMIPFRPTMKPFKPPVDKPAPVG